MVPAMPEKYRDLEDNLNGDLNNYYDTVAKEDQYNRMVEDGEELDVNLNGVQVGFSVSEPTMDHTARVVARITTVSGPGKGEGEDQELLSVIRQYKRGLAGIMKRYASRK